MSWYDINQTSLGERIMESGCKTKAQAIRETKTRLELLGEEQFKLAIDRISK